MFSKLDLIICCNFSENTVHHCFRSLKPTIFWILLCSNTYLPISTIKATIISRVWEKWELSYSTKGLPFFLFFFYFYSPVLGAGGCKKNHTKWNQQLTHTQNSKMYRHQGRSSWLVTDKWSTGVWFFQIFLDFRIFCNQFQELFCQNKVILLIFIILANFLHFQDFFVMPITPLDPETVNTFCTSLLKTAIK